MKQLLAAIVVVMTTRFGHCSQEALERQSTSESPLAALEDLFFVTVVGLPLLGMLALGSMVLLPLLGVNLGAIGLGSMGTTNGNKNATRKGRAADDFVLSINNEEVLTLHKCHLTAHKHPVRVANVTDTDWKISAEPNTGNCARDLLTKDDVQKDTEDDDTESTKSPELL